MSERTHRGKFVAASRALVVLVGLLAVAAVGVTSAPGAATAPTKTPPAVTSADAKPTAPPDKLADFIAQIAASTGIKLVPVAAGSFTMGSPAMEEGRDGDESPQTQVTFTQGFWLGRTPVTQGQYQALMGANPASNSASAVLSAIDAVRNAAPNFVGNGAGQHKALNNNFNTLETAANNVLQASGGDPKANQKVISAFTSALAGSISLSNEISNRGTESDESKQMAAQVASALSQIKDSMP